MLPRRPLHPTVVGRFESLPMKRSRTEQGRCQQRIAAPSSQNADTRASFCGVLGSASALPGHSDAPSPAADARPDTAPASVVRLRGRATRQSRPKIRSASCRTRSRCGASHASTSPASRIGSRSSSSASARRSRTNTARPASTFLTTSAGSIMPSDVAAVGSGPRFLDHPLLWKSRQLRDGRSCTWARRT
jgi:hypothetical protein